MSYLPGFEIEDGVLLKYTGDEQQLFIPEEVTEIAPLAFFKQESIVTVLIKSNVKKIGEQAFFCCPNLTEVAIDDGVEVIEDDLFFGCEALKRVVFGKGTKLIKAGVFNECPNIEVVGMMGKAADWAAVKKEEGWDDNLGLYGLCTTEDKRLVFPKGIPEGYEEMLSEEEVQQQEEEKKAKAEAEEAKKKENAGKAKVYKTFFYIFTLLALGFLIASIVTFTTKMEETSRYFAIHPVEVLWKVAVAVVSIILAEVFSIKENNALGQSWYEGSLLIHIIMVAIIAVTATSINLCKKNYEFYEKGVFYDREGGRLVAIDVSREEVASLLEVPDGVVVIKSSALRYSRHLYDLTLPDGLTRIDDHAFASCSELTNVTIPSTVVSIGDYAFEHCRGLTNIRYEGTVAQWNAIKKGQKWNDDTGRYTVYCTDGTASR